MSQINEENVRHIAKLARLSLTDDEVKKYAHDLSEVVTYVDDRPSDGICSMCESEFCSTCLREIDKLTLCPEHFKLYIINEWIPITNEMTTPDNPEKGVYIYDFKRHLWDKEKVASYIQNEYKINMEGDFIETYVQLHVMKDKEDTLRTRVEKKKVDG